jgi:hypothetical protein
MPVNTALVLMMLLGTVVRLMRLRLNVKQLVQVKSLALRLWWHTLLITRLLLLLHLIKKVCVAVLFNMRQVVISKLKLLIFQLTHLM